MKTERGHTAVEQRSIEEILESFPSSAEWAKTVMLRLKRIAGVPDGAKVLDVGAANGGFVAACNRLGYRCEGVEPWDEARRTAALLSVRLGTPIPLAEGTAESIPFGEGDFDVVHASSVIEHVSDAEKAFAEIYRVLKPGGVFWFSSASSMCPAQDEIRGFPLFGWYPDPLKRRIMYWARDAKPHLVGGTATPAVNWFTPWKARSLLKRHGFTRVYDRWDLRGEDEGGARYKLVLRAIRSTPITKLAADVAVQGCSYAAIK